MSVVDPLVAVVEPPDPGGAPPEEHLPAGAAGPVLLEVGGQLLLVSQFTLYGDCRKGRRPSYSDAAPPALAQELYQSFVSLVRRQVPDVQSGQFQASMEVELVNSGPVTLIIDTPQKTV